MPIRHVLTATLAGLALVPSAPAAEAAPPASYDRAACPPASTDLADFPRAVPLPQGEYTLRGYLRADCTHYLDLAMEVTDLAPERRHLVHRLRAKGFDRVTSSSRTVEVDMGPGAEPEVREEFKVHARGRGLRVKIELSFVGAAPRWSGTALVRYVVRPLR